jgi:hypothetical protein
MATWVMMRMPDSVPEVAFNTLRWLLDPTIADII